MWTRLALLTNSALLHFYVRGEYQYGKGSRLALLQLIRSRPMEANMPFAIRCWSTR